MIDPNEESDDNIVMSPALTKPVSKFSQLNKYNIFRKKKSKHPEEQQQPQLPPVDIHLLNITQQQQLLLLQQQQQLLLQQQQQIHQPAPLTFGNYHDSQFEPDIIVPVIGKGRDEWTNKIEYMLSVIGYVVDLGNCIRFPYICYKNGGGAFLVPYFIFLFVIGIPMMYLEMSIGQFFHVGNITLWSKVNIFMKGITNRFLNHSKGPEWAKPTFFFKNVLHSLIWSSFVKLDKFYLSIYRIRPETARLGSYDR
jgi:hypothetical protein